MNPGGFTPFFPKPYCQLESLGMLKKITAHVLIAVLVSASASAAPGTSENFNSRKGTPLRLIRAYLQNSCWTFHHFDVNGDSWNPKIEGDGAMVSESGAIGYANAGIYTPLLVVANEFDVSFHYKFNSDFPEEHKRWIRICLANAQNEIVQILEEVNINGAQATKHRKYATGFKNITPGQYRLVLLYGGSGGNADIAIDKITTSAPYQYEGGCSRAPLASMEHLAGSFNRTASGSLIDGNKPSLKTFLIRGSADGQVELNEDGNFRFIPAKNFTGRSTSFVYRVCDESGTNLCSPATTVRINFPSKNNNQLVDFRGSYKYNGNVQLAWVTQTGSQFDRFEVERSTDGRSWQTSGTITARQAVAYGNDYTYIDRVKKNTALKKDLYYRLRQVSADGTTSLSRLMVIRVYNTPVLTMISVTPNPLKKDLSVNVQLNESSYVTMKLRDQSGNTVINKVLEADRGLNSLLIEGSSLLTPGPYMLELIVNSKERMLVTLIKE